MLLTGAQLGDEELRREALHLCGLVVEHQREDGSFGAPSETFAARGRMLRALCAAYSMSGDKQLLTFMLRYEVSARHPPRALPVRRGRDAPPPTRWKRAFCSTTSPGRRRSSPC
ncbi:MAG: hypothetical protein ACLR4A_02380 [Christensenellales bacterium]